MNIEDKEVIDKTTLETKARYWTLINRYIIIEDFDDCENMHYENNKPLKDWNTLEKREFNNSRALLCMSYIEKDIGKKECLRYSNRDDMTNEEFEDFWNGSYENDTEAKERHDKRFIKGYVKKYNLNIELDYNKSSSELMKELELLEW